MNPWTLAAAGMMACLLPCGLVCLRGDTMSRVVGLQMTGVVVCLLLTLLCQGFHRVPFYDLPLALALLGFGAGLVFARFMEKWL